MGSMGGKQLPLAVFHSLHFTQALMDSSSGLLWPPLSLKCSEASQSTSWSDALTCSRVARGSRSSRVETFEEMRAGTGSNQVLVLAG
jgi:hypothetical protein